MTVCAQVLSGQLRAGPNAVHSPVFGSFYHSIRPRGLTLNELLVVIAILTLMLGIGIFAFIRSSQAQRERAAIANLETCIRQVRNSAIGSNAPAFVELIDKPETGFPRAIPWVYRLAGLWHFESIEDNETPGAFGMTGYVKNCEVKPGRFGNALALLTRDRDGKVYQGHIDCGIDKAFDLEYGGYLEAYIYGVDVAFKAGYSTASRQFIFLKDKAYWLAIVDGGVLEGKVGPTSLQAPNFRIPARRWTKVGFAWDRKSSRLLIDDGIVAVGGGMETPINNNELTIGSISASLIGLIDEPRIYAASVGKQVDLPKTILTHNTAPWNGIFFSPSGALDIRFHSGPVSVQIEQLGRKREVQINLSGMIKRIDLVKETQEKDDRWGSIGVHEDKKKRAPEPPPHKPLTLPDAEEAKPEK